jgi:type I restriction enzyme S subunit
LTGQDLARYRFPLPPLVEQRRIAAILDKADALRAKRRIALAQLHALTQSIFLDMFGDPVTNPKRWPTRSLAEIGVEFRYGTSNKAATAGRPTLRIPNVVGGGIDVSDLKLVPVSSSEFDRLRLRDGDLLFVRTNGNPDFVGRCAVFDAGALRTVGLDGEAFIFASYLIRGRLLAQQMSPIFLREYLLSSEGRRQMRARCKTSAGQYNINVEGLSAIEVVVPPVELQGRFVERLASVEVLRKTQRSALGKLDALLGSLQHRAFGSEL